MNVYTCRGFEGFYPVGTAAVVVAPDPLYAATLLSAELAKSGLPPVSSDEMVALPMDQAAVRVLCNGDY